MNSMSKDTLLLLLLSIVLAGCVGIDHVETAGEKVLRDVKVRPRAGGYTIHSNPWEVEELHCLDEYSRNRYPELEGTKLTKLWTHKVEGTIYRITYENDISIFKVAIWENVAENIRQVLMFRRLDRKHHHKG
jgi:hypothetical protein